MFLKSRYELYLSKKVPTEKVLDVKFLLYLLYLLLNHGYYISRMY